VPSPRRQVTTVLPLTGSSPVTALVKLALRVADLAAPDRIAEQEERSPAGEPGSRRGGGLQSGPGQRFGQSHLVSSGPTPGCGRGRRRAGRWGRPWVRRSRAPRIGGVQRAADPLHHLGCHRPLDGAAGMHSAADAARNQQPGEETHLYPHAVDQPGRTVRLPQGARVRIDRQAPAAEVCQLATVPARFLITHILGLDSHKVQHV
jgi:hypothetical protein